MSWRLHLPFPFRKKTSNRTVLAFFPAEDEQIAHVRRVAHNAGVSTNATSTDNVIADTMVMENWR